MVNFHMWDYENSSPTLSKGHMRDLVLTQDLDKAIECVRAGVQFSDYISMLYDIVNSNKPPAIKTDITYSKLKNIDIRQLKFDIFSHDLGNSSDYIDVLVKKYNQGLSDILDKDAPTSHPTILIRPKLPCFNKSLQLQRSKLRKLEKSGTKQETPTAMLFSDLSFRFFHTCLLSQRQNIVFEYKNYQKKLFELTKEFLW